MSNARLAAIAAIAVLVCAEESAGRAPSRAEAVVAAAKRATGGPAWDRPSGCYEEGTRGKGGVAYKTWLNLRNYGMRVESQRGGNRQAMGFNGKLSWQTGPDGKTIIRNDPGSLREAVVTAFLSNNGFFYPKRFPAALTYLREATIAGRRFDVIEMSPVGGRAFDVWFDRRTHLIRRVVDKHGAQPVTIEAGDYRRSGKLVIAFSLNVLGPGEVVLDEGRLTSFDCSSVDPAMFDPPREK